MRRIGKFEQCSGGTLFLDEIGDMAPSVQAKVLRVLQQQRFERVGGNTELTTDVRIIAATNRPLEQMVAVGEYREDLLYRLNDVTILLPPLRDRLSDVPDLIQFFMSQAKREFNKPDLEGLSPQAVEILANYYWPGNVRQLRSVIRRCVLDSVMPVITADGLPVEIIRANFGESLATLPSDRASSRSPAPGTGLPQLVQQSLREKSTNVYAAAMEYMERYVIMEVLKETGGNQSQAAEILGITRGKLRDRITSYNIVLKNDVAVERPPQ